MTESEEKRLQKIREKISQMKAQEKTITARENQRRRKAKTRRLVQLGTLAEKYFNCEDTDPLKFENLLKQIVQTQEVKLILEIEHTKNSLL